MDSSSRLETTYFKRKENVKADERNPEILDDWPLHKTTETKTKLVVGACWHGRQQAMAQFFNGELAAVHLLTGVTESKNAIECAHQCKEKLAMDEKEIKEGEVRIAKKERIMTTNEDILMECRSSDSYSEDIDG